MVPPFKVLNTFKTYGPTRPKSRFPFSSSCGWHISRSCSARPIHLILYPPLPAPHTARKKRRSPMQRSIKLGLFALMWASPAAAQTFERLAPATRGFVSVSEPVVALTNVRVIDGTGAPARDAQTIIIENGRIARIGASAAVSAPAGARVIDLNGHTVIPGIVGMHDHTFYTTSRRSIQSNFSFPRLYLASGVTTIRTTGSMSPYSELNLKKRIESARVLPFLRPPVRV